jgi:hypothetical protein
LGVLICDDLAPHWLWRSLHDLTEFPPLVHEVFESPPSPQAIRSRFILLGASVRLQSLTKPAHRPSFRTKQFLP